MKCRAAQKQFMFNDELPAPGPVSEHILACDACRRLLETNRGLRSLLALKRYETPDADFESRSAEKIRIYLKNHPHAGLRDWITAFWNPLPAVRILAAASILMLVAYHIGPARMPSLSIPLADSGPDGGAGIHPARPAMTRNWMAPPAAEAIWPDPARSFVMSNTGPARIQYGPAASRPVSFDY